jgi:hypothetical protein
MPVSTYRPLALCLAAPALAACSAKETDHAAAGRDTTTAAAAAPAPTPSIVTITAHDFALDMPDSIPAGLTTVRFLNQGKQLHHATFVKLADGHTMKELVASMAKPGPLPAWAEMAGGPNAVVPGDSSNITQTLDPGSYVALCLVPGPDGMPHFAKGMEHAFTVVPSAAPAATAPTPDVTVTLADYSFTLSTALTAGHHVIRVDNSGPQMHELVLVQLAPGKTPMDLVKWVDKQQGPPPGKPIGGLSPMHPGGSGSFVVDLTPGSYAFICFLPDAKDGKPHFLHGMTKQFTIS